MIASRVVGVVRRVSISEAHEHRREVRSRSRELEDLQGGSGPELEESVQRRWCNYHLMGKHLSGRLRKYICTGASLPTCSFPFA